MFGKAIDKKEGKLEELSIENNRLSVENNSHTEIIIDYSSSTTEEVEAIVKRWLPTVKYNISYMETNKSHKESFDNLVHYVKEGVIDLSGEKPVFKFIGREPLEVATRITGKQMTSINNLKNEGERIYHIIAALTGISWQRCQDEFKFVEMEVLSCIIPFLL